VLCQIFINVLGLQALVPIRVEQEATSQLKGKPVMTIIMLSMTDVRIVSLMPDIHAQVLQGQLHLVLKLVETEMLT